MSHDPAIVTRLSVELRPDPSRTVIRPFVPTDAGDETGGKRARRIADRVLGFDQAAVDHQMERVWRSLKECDGHARDALLQRFDSVKRFLDDPDAVPEERRLLLGGYLSAEYAFEATALFNPSIVPAPDQSGLAEGDIRFILSLRGIGEGHLSSVTFRTGVWRADGAVEVDAPSTRAIPPIATGVDGWRSEHLVQLDCTGSREPSETVLFPTVASQERGLEDLRLTVFTEEDGTTVYGGSFTALGSEGAAQWVLWTSDFRSFRLHPIHGGLAHGKGMAVFPRRIGGRFCALGRVDNENLSLCWSDDRFDWPKGELLLEPAFPWESVQIGNCGSPIELDEGWLVLTHGVGVVRNYAMGAALLDKDDPSKVIGRLREPLLEPADDERDGYVPNVVYSCGALLRGRTLLLPYGVADNFTRFATVDVDALVAAMRG